MADISYIQVVDVPYSDEATAAVAATASSTDNENEIEEEANDSRTTEADYGSGMGKLGGGGRGEIAEDEAVQTGDFERSERGDFERSERGDFERSERGDFERSERGDFERSERGDFERSETGDFERAETEEGGSVQVGDFDGRERKVIADKHPQALFDRVRVEEYEQMQGRETRTNEGGEDEEGDAAGIGGGDYIIQLTKLQQDATSESAIYRKDRSLANTYFKLYMCSGRNGTSYFSKGNSWIH